MLYDDSTAGQTFELYGPKNYSMSEIAEMVDREIFKKRRHINVPKAVLKPVAALLNRVLWWDIMSADEIEREFIDQEIDRTAKTFKDLGMEPGDISKFTYNYLVSIDQCALIIAKTLFTVMSRLTSITARIPERIVLRSASCYGEGEEGRQEIHSRHGRAVKGVGMRDISAQISWRILECTYT